MLQKLYIILLSRLNENIAIKFLTNGLLSGKIELKRVLNDVVCTAETVTISTTSNGDVIPNQSEIIYGYKNHIKSVGGIHQLIYAYYTKY